MADIDNANVMASLTQKITQIMTAPDTVNTGAGAADTFLAFCAPGIAIGEADLDFGDMTTKAQINANSAFAQLVNNIPNSAGFWGLTDKKVWDIYEDSISQVTLPLNGLTAEQQNVLKKAQDFLVEVVTKTDPFTGAQTTAQQDSRPYAMYKQCQAAYMAALKNYNGLQIQANAPGAPDSVVQAWMLNGDALQAQVATAWGNWVSNGYKEYVEEAIGMIANLTGQGPQSVYAKLNSDYAMARRKDTLGDTFLATYVYPANPLGSALDNSWLDYHFNLQDVKTFQSRRETNSGGSASANWGLWSARASASYHSDQTFASSDTSGLSLSVKLLQVPLTRPWMRSEIFWSRGWKFSPSSGLGLVSDGGLPPKGLMPLFPTAVVLARDLVINLDMTKEVNQAQLSSLSTSASAGWGPFSISGNYATTQSSSSHSFTKTDTGFAVPGPQIIAFVCEFVPLSPNPDPSLKWPDRAEPQAGPQAPGKKPALVNV